MLVKIRFIYATNAKWPSTTKSSGKLKKEKSIEVGNIFPLKTRFSDAFDLTYKDESGTNKPVIMGCYGIGLSRLMGAIAELNNDENGLIWPKNSAPFDTHLVYLKSNENKVKAEGEKLYQKLLAEGHEILYDDREEASAGEKLADADLIGIPLRIVVSERTLEKESVEIKARHAKEAKLIKLSEISNYVK